MALALLASLLIGAAGAYGYMRYSGAQERHEMQALRQERDELMEQARRQSAELDKLTLRLMALYGMQSSPRDAIEAERKRLQDKLSAVLQENESLNDRLLQAGEASAAADRQISDLRERIADLQANNADAQSQVARERDRLKNEDIPRLRTDLAQSRDEAAGLTAKLSDAQAEVRKQAGEMDALREELDTAKRQIQQSEDERRRLQAALEAAKAGNTKTADVDAAPSTPPVESSVAQPKPRNGDDVDAVLVRTPGLDRLTSGQRNALRQQLVSGACVVTALETAFGRAPLVTLRNMIRDLNSDC